MAMRLLARIPLRQLDDLEAVLGREPLVLLRVENLAGRRQLEAWRRLTHLLVKNLKPRRDGYLQQVALGLEAQPVRDVAREPDEAARLDARRLVAARACHLAFEQIPALVLFMVDVERRLSCRGLEVKQAERAAGVVPAGFDGHQDLQVPERVAALLVEGKELVRHEATSSLFRHARPPPSSPRTPARSRSRTAGTSGPGGP